MFIFILFFSPFPSLLHSVYLLKLKLYIVAKIGGYIDPNLRNVIAGLDGMHAATAFLFEHGVYQLTSCEKCEAPSKWIADRDEV